MTIGQLVSIEGCDGAGKTTQVGLLMARLEANGINAQLVREPGGTPTGEDIRRIVKMDKQLNPLTEMLLFQAARAELVNSVIKPSMEQGNVVVTDRFIDSSLAYQGYGRGVDLGVIHELNRISTGGLTPNLTILLNISPTTAMTRLHTSGSRRDDPSSERGFELLPQEFHERVASGYQELAAADPKRWLVIDACQTPENLSERIWIAVALILDP